MKVYLVITSKVLADFRLESPISKDFQSEILALLPPKSAKTFHESLQILSPLRKSRGKSLQTLEVITIQTSAENLISKLAIDIMLGHYDVDLGYRCMRRQK